ncbi:HNH endonuclease [Brevibacterium picturae]|uniref:HNH endonuclease signature motif containing protein n=1 Tax=Brevibacterium picturae TaxID=260553 RepID=A0ABP4M1R9_9MICO
MFTHPADDPDHPDYRGPGSWARLPGITTEIDRWCRTLRVLEPADNAWEAQTRIRALEELASATAAAQAREAVVFHTHRQREDAANDVPTREQGKYAGNEIALAKRVSPSTGRKFLSTSKAVINDLPRTYEALAAGSISEAKARIIADETAWLTPEERLFVDEELKDRASVAGSRRLRTEARSLAANVSSDNAHERAEAASTGRHVSLQALNNGMAQLSATLPLQQAVAAYENLEAAAAERKLDGLDFDRTRNQLMADVLVERLTGQGSASDVPTEVHVVMEAESLFSDGQVPAWIPSYGPLPVKTARNFLAANQARTFIRRMFTSPDTGQLVGMDSRRRTFGGLLRRMVVFRDDLCRTPWCDAPIRHADHVAPVAGGGETTWSNASGLCAACNYAKEHPGWKHKATVDDLTVSTPTGEEYETATPPFVTKFGDLKRDQPTRDHPSRGQPNRRKPGNDDGDEEPPAGETADDILDFPDRSPAEELFEDLILRDTG